MQTLPVLKYASNGCAGVTMFAIRWMALAVFVLGSVDVAIRLYTRGAAVHWELTSYGRSLKSIEGVVAARRTISTRDLVATVYYHCLDDAANGVGWAAVGGMCAMTAICLASRCDKWSVPRRVRIALLLGWLAVVANQTVPGTLNYGSGPSL